MIGFTKKQTYLNTVRYIKLMIMTCILFVLQFGIFNNFNIAVPNLLFALIIVISAFGNNKYDFIIIFIIGLLIDSISQQIILINSILFLVIYFTLKFLYSRYLNTNKMNLALTTLICCVLYESILFLITVPAQISYFFLVFWSLILIKSLYTVITSYFIDFILSGIKINSHKL